MKSGLRRAAGGRRLAVGLRLEELGRALVMLLVAAALSGVPSVIVVSSGHDGCGDSCRRCWCKQHANELHVRAPCPCCSRNPTAPAVIASIEPAVIERAFVPARPSRSTGAVPQYAAAVSLFAPPVPHPPPRVALPSGTWPTFEFLVSRALAACCSCERPWIGCRA